MQMDIPHLESEQKLYILPNSSGDVLVTCIKLRDEVLTIANIQRFVHRKLAAPAGVGISQFASARSCTSTRQIPCRPQNSGKPTLLANFNCFVVVVLFSRGSPATARLRSAEHAVSGQVHSRRSCWNMPRLGHRVGYVKCLDSNMPLCSDIATTAWTGSHPSISTIIANRVSVSPLSLHD